MKTFYIVNSFTRRWTISLVIIIQLLNNQRDEYIQVLCSRRGLEVGDLPDFARRTEGFVACDLATLADRVMLSQAFQGNY